MVWRPQETSMTVKTSKILWLVSGIFSGTVGIPFIVIYGRETVATPTPGVSGFRCAIDDDFKTSSLAKMVNMSYMLLFIVCMIALIVLYSLIAVKAIKHRRRHGQGGRSNSVTSQSSCRTRSRSEGARNPGEEEKKNKQEDFTSGKVITARKVSNDASDCETSVMDDPFPEEVPPVQTNTAPTSPVSDIEFSDLKISDDASSPMKSKAKTKKQISYERQTSGTKKRLASFGNKMRSLSISVKDSASRGLGRTTLMLSLISVMYILSYLPLLGAILYKTGLTPEQFHAMSDKAKTLYYLAVNSTYLGCAANPLIYSLVDAHFRLKCKAEWWAWMRWVRQGICRSSD